MLQPGSRLFYKVLKLKTLCVGGDFSRAATPSPFRQSLLPHAKAIQFKPVASYTIALELLAEDQEIDLVFLDADEELLPATAVFITQTRELRPDLAIILFSSQLDNKMLHLLRVGASWHFVKGSAEMAQLLDRLQQEIMTPVNWQEIFSRYDQETSRPRIEPSLSFQDLASLNRNPEERYIIKRLFAKSDVVQIFRMDEGFSGSHIYTVKPANQPKRIVKIGARDQLQAVKQKQEQLVQPRLNQEVGQIQGDIVEGQHLAGACFVLGGSKRDAITLTQFLQGQNRVRRELVDRVIDQLQDSLSQLYAGGGDMEMRYWAPLYARVLPPNLTLTDAVLIDSKERNSEYVLSAEQLNTLSLVPGNQTLAAINEVVGQGQEPVVILRGFVVSELDTKRGIIYLHDELMSRYPAWPIIEGREHPVLRFKIQLNESERPLLQHPVFRRGKHIYVRGRVIDTQEASLARNISSVTGVKFDVNADSFILYSGRYISPIANIRYLMWEIGREDMIAPMPLIAPVVHGDLNTSNILVGIDDDVPIWLIDFSDARPGHIYFDLAKLEVEFRTHVLYRLFRHMVDEKVWSEAEAMRFAMLVENVLLQSGENDFKDFLNTLSLSEPEWYDALYTEFPHYAENLLYFLFSIRKIAAQYSPDRFENHYATAVFFHSIAALKYKELDNKPWQPWAKRMALCAALVAGKHAVATVQRPYKVAKVLEGLKQRSAFGLITIGEGEERKYLLQWNDNWGRFNLIGGKMDNEKGDRDSFARTIQRELEEELELHSAKDYRITHEYPPVQKRQFSRRQKVFKDYEFRVYEISFLPRHPLTRDEYDWFAQRLSPERENVLVTRAEIQRLRTLTNRPISETTRMILQELGEIESFNEDEIYATLGIKVDSRKLYVQQGRAQLNGRLINPHFGAPVENITLEVMGSEGFKPEMESLVIRIDRLEVGEEYPLSIWLQPLAAEASITIRATYFDARGHQYEQNLEGAIQFVQQPPSMISIRSPYVVGQPLTVEHESLFVGRDDVFRWIEEHLLGKAQPHSLILYGQQRTGKTSVLQQLLHGRRGLPVREYGEYPIFLVDVNLQEYAGCDTREFFERLSNQIAGVMHQHGFYVAVTSPAAPQGTVYSDFDDFLDRVEASGPDLSLIVLVLDELEQLRTGVETGRLSPGILPYLRSLIQHRPRLSFIMAGTSQLVEDYWSAIFHAGIGHELAPLSRQETEWLIRQPVAAMIQFDDTAVESIWRAAGGHPYFTQLICHSLMNRHDGRQQIMNETQVLQAINQIITEDDGHLQHIWNESTREERFVLAALAAPNKEGGKLLNRIDLSNRLAQTPFAEDAINMALRQLEIRRLITRRYVEAPVEVEVGLSVWERPFSGQNETYTISYLLLRQWISRKHPLAAMLV